MNEKDFERLYSGCEKALKRFIYFKSPCKSDGDDILQETLLSAFLSKESVNPDSFKAWIIKIATNKIKDFYRKRFRAKEIPLEHADAAEPFLYNRFGRTIADDFVLETLEELAPNDARILRLQFYEKLPQKEIADILNVPIGTVKSRLYTAKQNFKSTLSKLQGESSMKKLPEILPDYTIIKSDKPPLSVKCEETMGWFIIPRLGEKCSWAMYDSPSKKRSETYELEVLTRASVHGIEGVEIVAREYNGGQHEAKPENREVTRYFTAQLTDTHCRYLSESHVDESGVKQFYTFLDSDEFISNWGFGENNCGKETNQKARGAIKRDGNTVISTEKTMDITGRYTVKINKKTYDTVCIMDTESYESGMVTEQFVDKNGRTVLWRRFNRDDWQISLYKTPWSARLPNNDRLTVNNETFVHWYDCITDYIL